MVFPVNDPRFCYAYRVKTLLSEGAKFSGEPDRDAGKTESISPNGIANFGKTDSAPEVGDGKGGEDRKKSIDRLIAIVGQVGWLILVGFSMHMIGYAQGRRDGAQYGVAVVMCVMERISSEPVGAWKPSAYCSRVKDVRP